MSETTTTIVEQIVTPVVEEHVSALVGEGKKYANVDALAKAYLNADEHIRKIIDEKRELENELTMLRTQTKTVDDLLAVIETPRTPAQTPAPQDLDKLLEEKLTRREQEMQVKRQVEEVKGKLVADFEGVDNLKKAIDHYTQGDKTKIAVLDQLVMVDYANAVKLLKAAVPEADQAEFGNGPSQRSTTGDKPSGLTWSKCEEIRKTNYKLYSSREFQKAMHIEASNNPNFMKT